DLGSDLDGDPMDAIAFHLDLSHVHAGPTAGTERAHDRRRATDRAPRAVEDSKCSGVEPIDLTTAKPAQLGAPDLTVEAVFRRAGDDEQRHQSSILMRGKACHIELPQERLDGVEDLVRFDRHEVIRTRQLDEARTVDALGDVPAFLDLDVVVAASMDDERR